MQRDADKAAHCENGANLRRRPVRFRQQKDTNKSSEPTSDIGKKKVQGI